MQSFAAENTTITADAEAGAGETQNGTTGENTPAESEESAPEATEAPAGEKKTKQEETPVVNEEKPAEEKTGEEAAAKDKKAEEPPVTEEKTEEAAPTTQEQPAQDNPLVVQEADPEGETVGQAETTEVEWFIEASRFGMVPKSEYATVQDRKLENTVGSAMNSFEKTQVTGTNISVDFIEQIIVKVLENEKDKYTQVSPNVVLEKNSSGYVTSVKFSQISD